MDTVQQELIALSHKVDMLYEILDQLSHQIAEALSEIKHILKPIPSSSGGNVRPDAYHSQSLMESVMEHKDILVENNNDNGNFHQNSENGLSADVQVQRLTAQLTAAYNRIAALEEQLLVRRIHS
ncbi:MAG TPA: hypothetical protein DCY91_13985 [Cyanobacteria bacterium UBA11370]|nr:hypothetical protein [Cyanobacteria bacterium UBA11370]